MVRWWASQLGINNGDGVVRRGKSIVPAEETTASAAYTTLTTPDQVTSVVLPTDGLLFVGFEALAKVSAAATVRAAIFLGANQVKLQAPTAPVIQEANTSVSAGNVNKYMVVYSTQSGLNVTADPATSYGSSVTTGQLLGIGGGPAVFQAAAGTYTVSVRWETSAGTLSVRERKLWVKAEGFQ